MNGIMGGKTTPAETSISQTKKGIQQIISRALKSGATTIHIEPMGQYVVVRYRRGGTLYQATTLPKSTASILARHFKHLAQLDVSQTRTPQSGQFLQHNGRKMCTIQVSTLPVIDGEKLTLTLPSANLVTKSLQGLGLWGDSLSVIQQALTQPTGLILIAGQQQTGSLAVQTAVLQLLAQASLAIAYIGDNEMPVLAGIKSVKIHPDAGWGFNRYLQVLAKQHFDVIGLSTIIDRRTAQTAIAIAEKGPLVMATIHANTAVQGLLYMQRATRQLSSIVLTRAIIGNVFVRGLCSHCREAYMPSTEERQSMQAVFKIETPAIMQRYHDLEQQAFGAGLCPENELSNSDGTVSKLWQAHPLGCKFCDNTGYGPQVGLFEVCQPASALFNALSTQKSLSELQTIAIKAGMISLKIDGFIKTLRGLIDYPTLLKVGEHYGR
jgi:type II secretory ATPase GspE/PulE/Tfp pilus assembly ATPase PilB-like protein